MYACGGIGYYKTTPSELPRGEPFSKLVKMYGAAPGLRSTSVVATCRKQKSIYEFYLNTILAAKIKLLFFL